MRRREFLIGSSALAASLVMDPSLALAKDKRPEEHLFRGGAVYPYPFPGDLGQCMAHEIRRQYQELRKGLEQRSHQVFGHLTFYKWPKRGEWPTEQLTLPHSVEYGAPRPVSSVNFSYGVEKGRSLTVACRELPGLFAKLNKPRKAVVWCRFYFFSEIP